MKITPRNSTTVAGRGTRDPVARFARRTTYLALAAGAAVIALLTYFITVSWFPEGIGAAVWEAAGERGYYVFPPKERLRTSLRHVPARLLASPDIPKLSLDISFLDMQKLRARRAEALEQELLVQQADDFVPAVIRHKDQAVRVKLRLKGDLTDHLKGDKWSFRIHVKGSDALFGLRRFSIQSPHTRGFQTELLFSETVRQFDIITPDYFFVDVTINGDDIGLMALEEHYAKEMLERHGRKDSVILKFDDTQMWDEELEMHGERDLFNDHLKSRIEAFGTGRIEKSATLSRDYATAVGLLRGFLAGHLKASDVFDAERMGGYLAVAQLWGANHALGWPNLRFYFNPLTTRLEPIAFDAMLPIRSPVGSNLMNERPASDILRDPVMERAYLDALQQLVAAVQDGSLLGRLQETENRALTELRGEYFLLENFDLAELAQRAANIPDWREDKVVDTGGYPTYIHAWLIENGSTPYLELANLIDREIEISAIEWDTGKGKREPFESPDISGYPLRMAATVNGDGPVTLRLPYVAPERPDLARLEVRVKISGTDSSMTHRARPYFAALKTPPMPTTTLRETLQRHAFLEAADDGGTLRVRPGSWEVHEPLVIPAGHDLEIPAGTTLHFARDSALVVYAATRFAGTQQQPVVLDGIDGANWMGVAVFGAAGRSHWSHVHVADTRGIDFPAWKLTGGVTFHRSDVDIEQCLFSSNIGEDALNIIHAGFTIAGSHFSNTVSDAFDGDFTTGTVRDSQFSNIGTAGGGDAVDVSGSEVTVTDSRFNAVNDKAVSVGERSTVHASGLDIDDVGTGAASKDGSSLLLEDSRIGHARHAGLMTYVKKPVYGPASLEATGIEFEHTERTAVAQSGSRLTLNGTDIPGLDLDVGSMYENEMRKGAIR